MTTILAIALLSLLASSTFSLFEAAFYAITPLEVELAREKKVFGAERFAKLRRDIDQPIAAILTWNTIAQTLGSAFCGALVAAHYGALYGPAGAEQAVAVFAALFTLAILVTSEIFPKSIGIRFAQQIAPRMAWPLQVMIWLAWPIARGAHKLMAKITRGAVESGPTTEEIRMMTRLAREGGHVRVHELRWVENVLQLDRITARDLMTPRTVVETLPAEVRVGDLSLETFPWTHTRMPLIENGNPDAVVGLVHGKDVFRAVLSGQRDVTLRDLAHGIDFVPEAMKSDALLDKLIVEKKHLVGVVDEYGGFEGIVTLEDVLEAMLGQEIVDEHDRHPDMQMVARRLAMLQALARQREADSGPR